MKTISCAGLLFTTIAFTLHVATFAMAKTESKLRRDLQKMSTNSTGTCDGLTRYWLSSVPRRWEIHNFQANSVLGCTLASINSAEEQAQVELAIREASY